MKSVIVITEAIRELSPTHMMFVLAITAVAVVGFIALAALRAGE
jgi:hypothetical protein